MELQCKQRAYLGGCASTLDPIFQIGGKPDTGDYPGAG